jgi:ABC-type uncharacterized transport system substrate-binding protein
MKRFVQFLAMLAIVLPSAAMAHPHIWISQVVRVVTKDGMFTHVEIEWRFDPFSSEIEIPLIDEDKDGKFSKKEIELLGADMMVELKKYHFMTWLNAGAEDFRPPGLPVFTARIDDPATFTLPDWDRSATDKGNNLPMPPNKQVNPAPADSKARNLVYVLRFALPKPSKTISVTTYDPDDFIRIEADKAAVPKECTLSKHPKHKAEYIKGYPTIADQVSCRLP